jgi:hypothetical protein
MAKEGVMTGKPLIESDRVEGTTVYDPQGNNIGSIKRLMIEKLSGSGCLCRDVVLWFLGDGRRGARHSVEQAHL